MIALPLALALAFTSAASARPEPTPLRVMSFNIRYGSAPDRDNAWDLRKDFLAQTITSFNPDLLGTQETLAHQRDFLRDKLPDFEPHAAGRDDGREAGEMAALFYRRDRFEKLDAGHFWLSETPEIAGSKGWDAALPRIASWVKLRDLTDDPQAPPILFLNAHLDHRGAIARQESTRLIRRQLATLGAGCRLVVTGDFNAAEASPPYLALFDPEPASPHLPTLVDTFRATHPERTPNEGTFSGFKADTRQGPRIDWVACSPDWNILDADIDHTTRDDGRTPSDHFPVTAILEPSRPDQARTLRILSYNIHHGEGTDAQLDLPRLARLIKSAKPDLVALQEVDRGTKRTAGVDQTAELARLTGMRHAFGRAIDYQGGQYGQAILSRFPLQSTVVHTLPGAVEGEQRIAFEARLTLDGRPLSFVTTHLHHQSPQDRLAQAETLNRLFASAEHPVILAGDLNATPGSPPISELAKLWTIAQSAHDIPLLTFPAPEPTRQLDYVLLRPSQSFEIQQAQVLDEPTASDHRPVLVILVWKPSSPE